MSQIKNVLYEDDEIKIEEDIYTYNMTFTVMDREFHIEQNPGSFTMVLPLRVWSVLRGYTCWAEKYLTMSDNEIRVEAEEWVNHRSTLDPVEDRAEIYAGINFAGSVDAPIADQIESYVRFFQNFRDRRSFRI